LAREQTSGRGRLARQWSSPKDAGLWFSALLRSPAPLSIAEPHSLSLLPLVTGVAMVRAIKRHCGVTTALKWPNDVLIADRKVGGLLVTRVPPDGFVIGIGLNTMMPTEHLPMNGATSLLVEGAHPSALAPEALLPECLSDLAAVFSVISQEGGDGSQILLNEYSQWCSTLGREVTVHLPDGSVLRGLARSIAPSGALVVATSHGAKEITTGDVVALR
jgi:BirA family biotin operon repressor/biotin-[acetyl-CoA-carboxylase] ligase